MDLCKPFDYDKQARLPCWSARGHLIFLAVGLKQNGGDRLKAVGLVSEISRILNQCGDENECPTLTQSDRYLDPDSKPNNGDVRNIRLCAQ